MTQKNTENPQKTQEKGNTKPSPRKRKWCITLNNYTDEEFKHLELTLKHRNYKYIIGKEVGEEKTPHLQGFICSKNPVSFDTIKRMNNRLHIEETRGSVVQNLKYCSKEGNYITNYQEKDFLGRLNYILSKEFENFNPRPFQQRILDIIKDKPDKRTIYWFHEPIGNVGKSHILKYIALKYPNKVIIGSGKKDNVFNQINAHMLIENEPEIILIDIPRDSEQYINYGCIENIKNGCFYSGKYEGGICLFEIPHVIVVSNEEPNYDKMSQDRYIVERLGGQLEPHVQSQVDELNKYNEEKEYIKEKYSN